MKNNVKKFRIEQSLTQQELANHIGITRQTIGLIEKGEYNPSLQLCINIALILGKGLDELFMEEII